MPYGYKTREPEIVDGALGTLVDPEVVYDRLRVSAFVNCLSPIIYHVHGRPYPPDPNCKPIPAYGLLFHHNLLACR